MGRRRWCRRISNVECILVMRIIIISWGMEGVMETPLCVYISIGCNKEPAARRNTAIHKKKQHYST